MAPYFELQARSQTPSQLVPYSPQAVASNHSLAAMPPIYDQETKRYELDVQHVYAGSPRKFYSRDGLRIGDRDGDICIHLHDGTVLVHSHIVSLHSKYFQKLREKISKSNPVVDAHLENLAAHSVRSFLPLLYFGKVDLREEYLYDNMRAAYYLKIGPLHRQLVTNFYYHAIGWNRCRALNIACVYECGLTEDDKMTVLRNFFYYDEMPSKQHISELTLGAFEMAFAWPQMYARENAMLVNIAMEWMRMDLTDKYLKKIMGYMRFPSLDDHTAHLYRSLIFKYVKNRDIGYHVRATNTKQGKVELVRSDQEPTRYNLAGKPAVTVRRSCIDLDAPCAKDGLRVAHCKRDYYNAVARESSSSRQQRQPTLKHVRQSLRVMRQSLPDLLPGPTRRIYQAVTRPRSRPTSEATTESVSESSQSAPSQSGDPSSSASSTSLNVHGSETDEAAAYASEPSASACGSITGVSSWSHSPAKLGACTPNDAEVDVTAEADAIFRRFEALTSRRDPENNDDDAEHDN